jgi:hypothetical protein
MPRRGRLRVAIGAARWASLAVSIVLLVMILIPSAPPRVAVPPDAVERVQDKVQEFLHAVGQGRQSSLEMDQPELNGWLGANLALRRDSESSVAASMQTQDPKIEEVQSSVRDVKIELGDDTLRAYVSFELYGKALSLEMEGRLAVRDGFLRLEPTAGKLGSLPLPESTLASAARRLFDSPENRDKFRVSPGITDIAVRHGCLVIFTR